MVAVGPESSELQQMAVSRAALQLRVFWRQLQWQQQPLPRGFGVIAAEGSRSGLTHSRDFAVDLSVVMLRGLLHATIFLEFYQCLKLLHVLWVLPCCLGREDSGDDIVVPDSDDFCLEAPAAVSFADSVGKTLVTLA